MFVSARLRLSVKTMVKCVYFFFRIFVNVMISVFLGSCFRSSYFRINIGGIECTVRICVEELRSVGFIVFCLVWISRI